jgi:hypothetical protein
MGKEREMEMGKGKGKMQWIWIGKMSKKTNQIKRRESKGRCKDMNMKGIRENYTRKRSSMKEQSINTKDNLEMA